MKTLSTECFHHPQSESVDAWPAYSKEARRDDLQVQDIGRFLKRLKLPPEARSDDGASARFLQRPL